MYAVMHQGVGAEPGGKKEKESGSEWAEWDERRRLVETAVRGLDQEALKQVLGDDYEDYVSMKEVRRKPKGEVEKEEDLVLDSVED